MTFTELNASGFIYNGVFYNAEFEEILSKIIICYNLMLNDNIDLSNDENSIRDVLLINYLKNNGVRKKANLTDFLFDREVPEDFTIGRTDIKVQTLNTFQDTNAYYIIECKRLDSINANGSIGLNAKYIENGIYRFASKYYSMHHKVNGMIGFIVHSIDINQNVTSINNLLRSTFTNAGTIQELEYREIISGYEFSYCSKHCVEENNVAIYHLMLDCSKNIQ